jgi:hypothetical protein
MSRPLEAAGYNVFSSDMNPRGYGEAIDFLTSDRVVESIITNPPYLLAEEFVRKALSCTTYKVAMLLPFSFWESKKRRALFTEHPPKRVYVFARRVSLYPGGDRGDRSSGKVVYAWFVWEHGSTGETTIQRIE